MTSIEDIRAEIAEEMSNAEYDSKQTQDDFDCGIWTRLQMALNIIDKHFTERGENEEIH